ncbi:hypothetical protein [Streptomyces crystallinus]
MAAVLGHVDGDFHAAAGIAPSPPLLTPEPEFVAPSWRYRMLDKLLRHAPAHTMTIPGLPDDFTVSSTAALTGETS